MNISQIPELFLHDPCISRRRETNGYVWTHQNFGKNSKIDATTYCPNGHSSIEFISAMDRWTRTDWLKCSGRRVILFPNYQNHACRDFLANRATTEWIGSNRRIQWKHILLFLLFIFTFYFCFLFLLFIFYLVFFHLPSLFLFHVLRGWRPGMPRLSSFPLAFFSFKFFVSSFFTVSLS